MVGREKGVETLPCPKCGSDRPVHQQDDGSKAADACPKCWPAESEKASAAAPQQKREQGTTDIPTVEVVKEEN